MKKQTRKVVIGVIGVAAVAAVAVSFMGGSSDGDMEVSVTIQCDQLLGEGANIVDENTRQYIPEDGYVLKEVKVNLADGANAFDALEKACEENEIALDHENASYGVYVKGINYLYEVSTDSSYAGWMYNVNSEEPSVSASDYVLEAGDDVLWYYSAMTF